MFPFVIHSWKNFQVFQDIPGTLPVSSEQPQSSHWWTLMSHLASGTLRIPQAELRRQAQLTMTWSISASTDRWMIGVNPSSEPATCLHLGRGNLRNSPTHDNQNELVENQSPSALSVPSLRQTMDRSGKTRGWEWGKGVKVSTDQRAPSGKPPRMRVSCFLHLPPRFYCQHNRPRLMSSINKCLAAMNNSRCGLDFSHTGLRMTAEEDAFLVS